MTYAEEEHEPEDGSLSRREFLKRSGKLGIAAYVLPIAGEGKPLYALNDSRSNDGYEYAAGQVTLPFSYTTERSPAPKPDELDFQHQVSPDNCQVFVRIDDELWAFRSQWVINLGTTARYKGPDIDHMTRVEDGTYPPGMTACWFLGGMWYDKAAAKLYAPMHIEHDGPRRSYPFSRKIALATSTDKGLTWHYEGDIITSETYYYPHDFFKFSGLNYGNGLADFGFYVDLRGGYFYIFPDEGWAPMATRGIRWNSRAARCAINDKMAPGKWSNFYNGNWDEPALGGKSSTIAPSHLWGVAYSTTLGKYIALLLGNQDPPDESNIDGVYIGCCSDLAKQDWIWGYCPEGMFGFMNVINNEGTDVANVCGDSFRFYSYFGPNDFERRDFKLKSGQTSATGLQPRYLFEPHPESSDPLLGRMTKIVGCSSSEMKYAGAWNKRLASPSYEGITMESSAPGSSVEFSFEGTEVYWRALHSPRNGRADVYVDGILSKQVDCYSPRSTSYEQFLYIKTGLKPGIRHTIKVVVTGTKYSKAASAAIEHIAFEFSAESYKASAGFSAVMGKNNWFYEQSTGDVHSDLAFVVDEAHPRLYWSGSGDCRIGANYQIPGDSAAIRKWIAPHGGVLRIEGTATTVTAASASIWLNSDKVWANNDQSHAKISTHDLKLTVIQGDSIRFVAQQLKLQHPDIDRESSLITWDPVITYNQSVPAVWQPNPPASENLALNKSARSKVLVSSYRPFDAVDGDLNTGFTLHSDDRLSKGDDWLQVDLEKIYIMDHYVVSSQTADPVYRPETIILQKSDDGLNWTEVDSVSHLDGVIKQYYGIPMISVERTVPPFRARYVRLYLPKGKPFTISEFELHYTEGKIRFGPPSPAG